MTEKQLIENLKSLKGIKPRQEWASLLKSEILNPKLETNYNYQKNKFSKFISNFKFQISNSFFRRAAYSLATIAFVMIGVLGFAQSTLPGDALFPFKKIAEQSQAALIGANTLQNNFDAYDRRVQDLVRIVAEDKQSNIPSAINEVKESMAVAVKSVTDIVKQEDGKSLKDIVADVKKIEDNQNQLKTLGVDVGESEEVNELNSVLAPLVRSEIDSLEKATLSDVQKETLEEINVLYEQEKYSDALEKILLINEAKEPLNKQLDKPLPN